MALTDTTAVPAAINNFLNATLLERAVANFIHKQFGMVANLPQKNSKVIKFRKYNSIAVTTGTLTEGVTPTAVALAITDITATVAQYGKVVELTDIVVDTTIEAILTELALLLGQNAGDTFDQVAAAVLAAGTTVQFANGKANRGEIQAADILNTAEVRKLVRTLNGNNANKFAPLAPGSTAVGTTPIDEAYWGFVHPNAVFDLKADSNFIKVAKYPNPAIALPNEVGSLDEVRFVSSTNGTVFVGSGSGSADVYATVVCGENAYAVVDLDGRGLEMITKPFGSGDDALNQRMTGGWKGTNVTKILNETWIIRVEHGVSA